MALKNTVKLLLQVNLIKIKVLGFVKFFPQLLKTLILKIILEFINGYLLYSFTLTE